MKMTEEELEQRISDMIDNSYPEIAERFDEESISKKIKDAIRKFEIDNLKKAVEQVENVSRLRESKD